MATNTGEGHRKGAVKERTQTENPQTGDFTKRNRDIDSSHDGEFIDVKEDGKKFKGVRKSLTNGERAAPELSGQAP